MHLLDTDVLTHLFVGNARVIDRLQGLPEFEVGTTIISKIEIMRGRHAFVMKASNSAELLRATKLLQESEEFLSRMMVVSIDEDAAAEFDQLRSMKKLKRIGRADLLIASIALASRAVLVTRNIKDFRQIPNLKTENWID